MISKIRQTLAKAVPNRWKPVAKRMLGIPPSSLNHQWSILQNIGPVTSDHLVLDIGAHHGWFFHCWQNWCPKARILAFEPFPDSFKRMQELYGDDKRVRMVRAGVGSTHGVLNLNVLEGSLVSNSFLRPETSTWSDISFRHGQVSRLEVPVTTIDDVVEQEHIESIYLLKIDVQGFEMEVLRGAGDSLSKVQHVFVESGIRQLYEGAPRFSDVFEYLTARDFHLMAMRSWHRGNHVLVEADMLFRRNDLALPVDPRIDRVYEQNG